MKVLVADRLTLQTNRQKRSAASLFFFKGKTLKFRTLLLPAAVNLMVLLLFTGSSSAQCALSTTSPSVTICSPSSGATAASPVTVVAGTTDTYAVTAMKVYVDSVNVYTAKAAQLSTSLTMANGEHHISVNAWDSSGAVFKSSATITVSATSAPAPVLVSISPTVATLATGQTQQFTATVTNTTNTAVSWSVDGIVGGNAGVGIIATSGLYTAGTSTGTHNVIAISQADASISATAMVTVAAPATINSCTPASAAPSVTICNPVSGSTVYSPVTLAAVAASNTAVTKFLLYLDYVLVDQSNTASIDASLTLAAGTHHLTAQFYTGSAWVKLSETFTVSTAPPPPPVSVGITPTTASVLTSGTQPFTAEVEVEPPFVSTVGKQKVAPLRVRTAFAPRILMSGTRLGCSGHRRSALRSP